MHKSEGTRRMNTNHVVTDGQRNNVWRGAAGKREGEMGKGCRLRQWNQAAFWMWLGRKEFRINDNNEEWMEEGVSRAEPNPLMSPLKKTHSVFLLLWNRPINHLRGNVAFGSSSAHIPKVIMLQVLAVKPSESVACYRTRKKKQKRKEDVWSDINTKTKWLRRVSSDCHARSKVVGGGDWCAIVGLFMVAQAIAFPPASRSMIYHLLRLLFTSIDREKTLFFFHASSYIFPIAAQAAGDQHLAG